MKNSKNKETGQQLLFQLNKGSEQAFSSIFNLYYKDLVLFAGNILRDKFKAEDVVQAVFLKLWDIRSEIKIENSLRSYLLKSVQNKCFDIIKHNSIVNLISTQDNVVYEWMLHYDTENYILYSELQNHIDASVDKLPEKYRNVFLLGKIHGMKYAEISEQLLISERTVELWMSKALELMRIYLKEFLSILSLLFVNKI